MLLTTPKEETTSTRKRPIRPPALSSSPWPCPSMACGRPERPDHSCWWDCEPGVADGAASKLRAVVGKGSGVVGNSLQLLSQGLRVLSAGFQFGSLAGSSDLVPDGAGRISAASAGGKAALGVSGEHG